MSIGHTVVLLPGLQDTSTQTTALQAALSDVAQVLTPDITVSTTKAVILEDPALRVLDAMSTGIYMAYSKSTPATREERVAALMLSTNARLETIVVRSLFYGILSLLPASIVQQLGARPAEVLDLLDQVRPADFRSLAERVPAPALIIVGEQDVANRGPSAGLARSLPLGNLRVVPRAGAGCLHQPRGARARRDARRRHRHRPGRRRTRRPQP